MVFYCKKTHSLDLLKFLEAIRDGDVKAVKEMTLEGDAFVSHLFSIMGKHVCPDGRVRSSEPIIYSRASLLEEKEMTNADGVTHQISWARTIEIKDRNVATITNSLSGFCYGEFYYS